MHAPQHGSMIIEAPRPSDFQANSLDSAISTHSSLQLDMDDVVCDIMSSMEDDTVQSPLALGSIYPAMPRSPLMQTMSNLSLSPSPNASTTQNPNATKKPRSSKRTNSRKKAKANRNKGSTIGYAPNTASRAQGNIQISKSLTEHIVPHRVAESIANIYAYMDKATVLSVSAVSTHNPRFRVIDYDWHCKNTNDALYCVTERQDVSTHKARGYAFKMHNRLYTAHDLSAELNVSPSELPVSWRKTQKFRAEMALGNEVIRALSTTEQRLKMVNSCQWHKVPVLKRVNNKRRLTLSLTKPQFTKQCVSVAERVSGDEISKTLFPIAMFNSETDEFWLEWVWTLRIDDGVSVGIAFRYQNPQNGVRVSGIHLDRDYLQEQHELVHPGHAAPGLRGFESNISDLRIGNPDDLQNKINYYKQLIASLTVHKEDMAEFMAIEENDLRQFQSLQRRIRVRGEHGNLERSGRGAAHSANLMVPSPSALGRGVHSRRDRTYVSPSPQPQYVQQQPQMQQQQMQQPMQPRAINQHYVINQNYYMSPITSPRFVQPHANVGLGHGVAPVNGFSVNEHGAVNAGGNLLGCTVNANANAYQMCE